MSIVAYLDAGTGSMIAATAVAGFAGAATAVRSRWSRATGKLRGGQADAESVDVAEDAADEYEETEPTESA